jgi:glycosyltransferase involved in cell wall biosynthesis
MTTPAVSVVVPAFNAEAHVAETLDAILAQTRPADEVIVVDDGSTDGTPAVLARYADRVRVIRQRNRGAGGAYTHGFEEASGDYVARCDADDLWVPDKLERQLAFLAAHPEADIVFSGARIFGSATGPYSPAPGEGVLDRDAFTAMLFRANLVCASSIVMRRRLFLAVGPFEDHLPCEDYDFLLRAAVTGAVFAYQHEELVRYRRHGRQVTQDRLRMEQTTHAVHRRHAGRVPDRALVRSVLAADLASMGRMTVDQGAPAEARALFAASLRERPTPFAAAWLALLSVPSRGRDPLVGASLALSRRLRSLRTASP